MPAITVYRGAVDRAGLPSVFERMFNVLLIDWLIDWLIDCAVNDGEVTVTTTSFVSDEQLEEIQDAVREVILHFKTLQRQQARINQ